MSAAALPLKLELRKQRRGRIILSTAGILGLWTVWTVFLVQHRSAKNEFAVTDFALLDVMGMAQLFCPIFIAVIAARLAAVDQQERMGQVFDALGQSLRQRFVAKLLILNALAALCCVLLVVVAVGFGVATGMPSSPELPATAARCLAVLLLGSVAIAAVQLALAMRFPDRPIGLIVSVAGAFLTSALEPLRIPEAGWLTPWSLIVGASPLEPASAYLTGTAAATPQLLTTPTGVFDVIALIVLAAAWTAAAIWFVTKPKELS